MSIIEAIKSAQEQGKDTIEWLFDPSASVYLSFEIDHQNELLQAIRVGKNIHISEKPFIPCLGDLLNTNWEPSSLSGAFFMKVQGFKDRLANIDDYEAIMAFV